MKIKIKCEPFSHRNERSHHIYCHCHCFIWRNRNRSSSNKSTKFIYYRDMFLSSLLFSVMCSFPFHLICVMMMLLPFFCACYLLQHRSSISQYSSSFFEKKRNVYTSHFKWRTNIEQKLFLFYFLFIFTSSYFPTSFIPFSAFPSLLFLSKIQQKKIPQTR